ncbi:hypothetical protein NE237_018602 [Protea cynaroides]|uniref:Mannan endo-1,4-beta-mannosidase n=1 Tax=Protea cynaroides TaxID=273540 RepID=A0A9Q0KA69_9MAGN|nr:hypothetical protein NE237_018602 [Protea cynaroides]
MLEFYKEKGLTSMVEVVKMDYVINKAMERLEKNNVRYWFIVDVVGRRIEMAIYHLIRQLMSLLLLPCILSLSFAATGNSTFQIKAVNLGGWLVTEGWIKPSLFDGIPNNDLMDGTQLQFKSVKFGMYLSAESGGGTIIVANRTSASGWETFKLWRINKTTFQFRVFNGQFVGLDVRGNRINVVAVSNISGRSETFEIVRKSDDLNRVRIRAPNGFFLQAKTEDLVTADWKGDEEWRDDDPSVFETTNVGVMQGEFQITNGYGPQKAPQVMREHWNTFIVEQDFKFISENGLNAVRIPVGWWIACGPNPPRPYVGGSLKALDNAFLWAQKYNVKVIIDLHAAPGSQNGNEHSSSRDGSQEWGKTDKNIYETVAVIDFLTARYANNPSLYAVELINEPLSPGVSLESLLKYYKAGYKAVRKHTSRAYVVLSNRLGPADPKELFPLANGLRGSVIDVHYYNLYSNTFANMNVQQNIDFIYTNRSAQLNYITTSNGPLTFVGFGLGSLVALKEGRGGNSSGDFNPTSEDASQEAIFGSGVLLGYISAINVSLFSTMLTTPVNVFAGYYWDRMMKTQLASQKEDKCNLRVNKDSMTADWEGVEEWSGDDPSVFEITIVGVMRGEFQITNGYGPDNAPQVMTDCIHESYRSSLPLHGVGVEEDRSGLENSGSSRPTYNILTIEDVAPIEKARARFLQIIVDHFINEHVIEVTDCESEYGAQSGQDKINKRRPREVQYEGDPRFVLPLMYVANLYATLVNDVNMRLVSLDGTREKNIGVALEAAGGLYRRLAKKFPRKGIGIFMLF